MTSTKEERDYLERRAQEEEKEKEEREDRARWIEGTARDFWVEVFLALVAQKAPIETAASHADDALAQYQKRFSDDWRNHDA